MQSSYSVIKKDCALDGDKRKISTNYVIPKKQEIDELEEEKKEEQYYSKEEVENLYKQYEEIGKRIIKDANNEKEAILLRATMQAQTLEKEAYEKGYDEGIKNGYDDGYKKAFDENIDLAKEKAEEIIKRAEEILDSANENYVRYLEKKKIEVINLSLEIARTILKKEIEYKGSMNLLVEQAIELSKGEQNIIIKCNSIHVDDLKAEIEKWKISYSIKEEIFILTDDFMEPGNAILEKPSGKVIVGIDIGMESIRKEIFG
ncbi:FliH/SctL family protein [Clostridium sp. CTA-5]